MNTRWLGLLLLATACDESVTGDPASFDGSTSAVGSVDAGHADAGDAGSSLPTGATSTGLPCDVAQVVQTKCGLCHTDPPSFGAPTALTKQSHFAAQSLTAPGSTVAARAKIRIADPVMPMPPVGQPTLTDAEKQTLGAWLDQGAPASSAVCATPQPDAGSATPDGGSSGDGAVSDGTNDPYSPPDSECDVLFEMRAHGGQTAGDATPFSPPQGSDHYEIFYFTPPWTEKVHTIRVDPIVDNAAVLHHWLLYQETSGGGNGSHVSDSGLQSGSSQLLSGWAPGNNSLPLARHIGLQTISGPNARFGIEIHYNTTGNPANRADRSGVKLCVTKTLREHEASVHWLGTQAIFLAPGDGQAQGRCTPTVPGGVAHVIAHSPHMHKTGVHLSTVVKRKTGGTTDTLWDAPFQFDDQQIYPINNATREQLIYPGDVLTTTCKYKSTGVNTFGPKTNQEMCYNFVVAWPAGSLSNGVSGAVGGQNSCIDPGT